MPTRIAVSAAGYNAFERYCILSDCQEGKVYRRPTISLVGNYRCSGLALLNDKIDAPVDRQKLSDTLFSDGTRRSPSDAPGLLDGTSYDGKHRTYNTPC